MTDGLVALGYVAFAFLTARALHSAQLAPGTWLGRRAVRRAIVVGLFAVCAGLVAAGAVPPDQPVGTWTILVVLLVLLNVALGRATQRMATAPAGAVDERQEALRNRAHRIAYWTLALLVGGTVAVAQASGPPPRSWPSAVLANGGAGLALMELLFTLPGMVVAWLEPDHLPVETVTPAASRRARLALGMLAVAVAWPLLLSAALVVLPLQTTSRVSPNTIAADADRCTEVMADTQVGVTVRAHIPVHATVCWDGRRARQAWGLNDSDCRIASSILATVATSRCTRTTDPDGTLRFTYGAVVRPSLLPFLHREVTMRVIVDRNGRVVQLP